MSRCKSMTPFTAPATLQQWEQSMAGKLDAMRQAQICARWACDVRLAFAGLGGYLLGESMAARRRSAVARSRLLDSER